MSRRSARVLFALVTSAACGGRSQHNGADQGGSAGVGVSGGGGTAGSAVPGGASQGGSNTASGSGGTAGRGGSEAAGASGRAEGGGSGSAGEGGAGGASANGASGGQAGMPGGSSGTAGWAGLDCVLRDVQGTCGTADSVNCSEGSVPAALEAGCTSCSTGQSYCDIGPLPSKCAGAWGCCRRCCCPP
jgi:hypothetical protein